MTEREALYAAILADPAADAPRLVYADWLDEFSTHESDHARAKFIRLEIDAENTPHETLERAALEREAAKLYSRYCDTWNDEIPGWSYWYESRLIYRRGFPDELQPHFRRFVVAIDEMLDRIPLQIISLRNIVSPLPPIGQFRGNSDQLRFDHIHTLRLGPGVTELTRVDQQLNPFSSHSLLVQLLDHPRFTRLRRLEFNACYLNSRWVTRFAKRFHESRVRATVVELDLSDNQIADAGGMYLASASELANIRVLNVRGNDISRKVRDALTARYGEGLLH
jgi:uncharacterized protein (TIGR02996 family)